MIYTNRQFRCQVIRYLDQFWAAPDKLSQIEKSFGYTDRYFKSKFRESFGISYAQYLKKFRLHRAAMEMCRGSSPSDIGQLAGFSNAQSFSKAFREEFGVSPRKFLKNRWDVPDLPVCHTVKDRDIEIEYEAMRPADVQGQWQEWDGEKIFIGSLLSSGEESDGAMVQLRIPADYYAVISVSRRIHGDKAAKRELPEDAAALMKELFDFAMEEWSITNKKTKKRNGVIYGVYSDKRISILIPLYRKSLSSLLGKKETGPVSWINYIDDHLTEDLTIAGLALYFHYSEKHFRDTFHMYYGVTPDTYIHKRRLYMVVRALKAGHPDFARLVARFRFQSTAYFRREFFEAFRKPPEKYRGEYKAEDLIEYYDKTRDKLSFRLVTETGFSVMGKNVEEGRNDLYADEGLIGCIVTALRSNAEAFPVQAVVWQTKPETREHICLAGSVTAEEMSATESFTEVRMEGGVYAVMESMQPTDEENLEDVYRMLYRCAFRGWLVENRERIDLERLTFVRYENGKLQFYIPVFQ